MTKTQIFLFVAGGLVGASPALAFRFGLWVLIPASLLLLSMIVILARGFVRERSLKRLRALALIKKVQTGGAYAYCAKCDHVSIFHLSQGCVAKGKWAGGCNCNESQEAIMGRLSHG